MNFTLPFVKRIFLFLCVTIFLFAIANFSIGLFIYYKGVSPSLMRIAAVLQDVLVFIAPSIITAVMINRLPARFLEIEKLPRFWNIIIACCVLIVSIPAINVLVAWNESIRLPESMQAIEQWMRASEESAQASIEMIIGQKGVGALIVSILIVGVLAGFSEELFFRGTLQRLMSTGGINIHVSIWLAAFIFSAVHLQFYGFFGRFVLGLYFGYLLFWSRSLWLPVIVHILNNTIYILGNKVLADNSAIPDVNTVGTDNVFVVIVSCILIALGLRVLYLRRIRI